MQLFSNLNCQGSINQLVEKSYKAALAYLRLNCNKVSKIFAENDLTFSEAAISSIAPLFCTDINDHNLPIVKEFNIWKPPIQTEEEAIYFLNKVIAKRVDQYIVHLLKEHDPFFAKILDLVNYMVRKNGFKKISYLGRKYIVAESVNEIEGKVIDEDDFAKLSFGLFTHSENFLINILSHLESETNFFPAIPVNMLVNRLRELNHLSYILEYSSESTTTKLEIDEIVSYALKQTIIKLHSSYALSNKLNPQEIEHFRNTLMDIAKDLKDGGINRGLFEYFKQHANNLDKKNYQEKYHNILEYLVKVMKNHIKEKILVETK